MEHTSNLKIMFRMLKQVKPLSGYMVLAVLTGVIGFVCAIFIPVYGSMAIGTVLGYASHMTVSKLLMIVIVCALFRGVFHYIEQASNHYIAFRILAMLRDQVFKALRRLAPAKLEGRDKGDLISLITNDIELLEVFYAHTISPILIAILTCGLMLVLFAHFHIIFALIALLAYGCVGWLFPYIITKMGRQDGQQVRDAAGDFSTYTLESLRGMRSVLQYHMGEERKEGMRERSENLNTIQKRLKDYEGMSSALNNVGVTGFTVLMLMVGSYLYFQQQTSFIMVFFATILMVSSFGPVLALSALSNNLLLTLASARRVLAILDEQEMVQEVYDKENIVFNDIMIKDVSFAYKEELVLEHINANIEKNSITGVFGKSGSGKSTLLRLLMRFWDVKYGSIQLNQTPLEHINTSNLRNMQSFVTQETVLFHDTIANNLKIAKQDASQEELEDACRKASIHDVIVKLPLGYETIVQELGNSLSGGEKQRIGVARAFLHESDCILLDEPTSNLDALNEAVILKSLKQQQNKTIILVSHRPSTMKIADAIIHVENGRVS